MRPLHGSFCSICGEALLSPAFMERGDALCGLCQRAHPPFEKALAYGSYDGGLRELIHLLKYDQVRPAGNVLGRMLAETIGALESALPAATLAVIPVPLHKRKQAQRGFNQSEVIARAAIRCIKRPNRFEIVTGVLQRTRETGSQIGLTRHQRRENLRGAFAVSNAPAIAGRNILLVDDVYTTGTTASECSRVLRRAGAAHVWVATVARTLKVAGMFAVPEHKSETSGEMHVAAAATG